MQSVAASGDVCTIHLLRTQRTAALPLIERFLRDFDRSTVEAIHEFFAPRWQRLPTPAADGIPPGRLVPWSAWDSGRRTVNLRRLPQFG